MMLSVLDSMMNVIEPEMERHTDKWGGTYSGWMSNYEDLYEFIEERCAYLEVEGMEDCFDTPAYPIEVQIDPPGSDNEVKVNTIIPADFPFSAVYFGGVTFNLTALPASGYIFDHWEFLHNTPSSTTDEAITVGLEVQIPLLPILLQMYCLLITLPWISSLLMPVRLQLLSNARYLSIFQQLSERYHCRYAGQCQCRIRL